MRLSKEDKDVKIVELYKSGVSFRRLQKQYHKSPNYIAKLVQGIGVVCTACGKPKGKVRFHAHHPDRVYFPDYTIPLCPSCHAKEEAKLRRENKNKPRSPLSTKSTASFTTENIVSKPSTPSLSFPRGPLSSTEKKVIAGAGIAMAVEAFSPGFFEKRWQEIQEHWHKS